MYETAISEPARMSELTVAEGKRGREKFLLAVWPALWRPANETEWLS